MHRLGAVHILVNNAGVTRDGLVLRMKSVDWDEVLNTNLKGAFLLTQALLQPMMKVEYREIIDRYSASFTHLKEVLTSTFLFFIYR